MLKVNSTSSANGGSGSTTIASTASTPSGHADADAQQPSVT